MRVRKKKNLDKRMQECSELLLKTPAEFKGRWSEKFGKNAPLFLEIGCGKGTFICEMAKQNPDVNFIAIERVEDVCVMAMEKVLQEKISNVFFLSDDAKDICEIFDKNEIDRIYINFCDPWKKNKHAKRRLTHENFLTLYKNALPKDGEIHFKTDNQKLFEFSLNEMIAFGLKLKNISLDLHASEFSGNIITEYEQSFMDKGQNIYRLEAVNIK